MEGNKKILLVWLASGCMLVAAMVVIGGITRLTESGLSMVDWRLIMGTIPPLSEAEWQETFDQYKAFPEYQLINYDFSLSEFKSIFWWEYIHRVLGRLIGIVFIVPFVLFLARKALSGKLVRQLLLVFLLGGFQGFLGWFMVRSGLVNDPDVSHYRLAAHLITAFFLFAYLLWIWLEQYFGDRTKTSDHRQLITYMRILFGLLVIQILFGAFVSGLKAGNIYNTWPMMGDQFIAESVRFALLNEGLKSLVENHASVQFVHRMVPVLILTGVVVLFVRRKKFNLSDIQHKGMWFVLLAIAFQFVLGVTTLVTRVPVTLGVLHQFGALVVLGAFIFFYFHLWKSYLGQTKNS